MADTGPGYNFKDQVSDLLRIIAGKDQIIDRYSKNFVSLLDQSLKMRQIIQAIAELADYTEDGKPNPNRPFILASNPAIRMAREFIDSLDEKEGDQ